LILSGTDFFLLSIRSNISDKQPLLKPILGSAVVDKRSADVLPKYGFVHYLAMLICDANLKCYILFFSNEYPRSSEHLPADHRRKTFCHCRVSFQGLHVCLLVTAICRNAFWETTDAIEENFVLSGGSFNCQAICSWMPWQLEFPTATWLSTCDSVAFFCKKSSDTNTHS